MKISTGIYKAARATRSIESLIYLAAVSEALADDLDADGAQARRWVQGRSQSLGTTVVINDTAPTADRWNLALVEVPPASSALSP